MKAKKIILALIAGWCLISCVTGTKADVTPKEFLCSLEEKEYVYLCSADSSMIVYFKHEFGYEKGDHIFFYDTKTGGTDSSLVHLYDYPYKIFPGRDDSTIYIASIGGSDVYVTIEEYDLKHRKSRKRLCNEAHCINVERTSYGFEITRKVSHEDQTHCKYCIDFSGNEVKDK